MLQVLRRNLKYNQSGERGGRGPRLLLFNFADFDFGLTWAGQ